MHVDHSVFVHKNGVIIAIYVDDLLLLGPILEDILKLKEQLANRFRMKDLGAVAWYLGMQITRDRAKRILWISQSTYIKRAIEDLGMTECNPTSTPMDVSCKLKKNVYLKEGEWITYESTKQEQVAYQSIIGTLLWIACQTRPDIAFAVGMCSRYSANPNPGHDMALKRIIRYLAGTADLGLRYGPSEGAKGELVGYTDAAYGDCLDTRYSTSGYIYFLWNGPISWSSKRQTGVTTSTAEAEYVGECNAAKEAIFLAQALKEVGYEGPDTNPVTLLADNQAAIKMASNPVNHPRGKHIDVSYHYVRWKVAEEKSIYLDYIPTKDMIADGLTKALVATKFMASRDMTGLSPTPVS